MISTDLAAVEKLGRTRWHDIRRVLSFKGNFISGYRLYAEAWGKPAQGKFFTEPCAIDSAVEWMITQGILRPSKFRVQPERGPAVGLIGYNAYYLKHELPKKPIAGHYVDWDYEVTAEVSNPYTDVRVTKLGSDRSKVAWMTRDEIVASLARGEVSGIVCDHWDTNESGPTCSELADWILVDSTGKNVTYGGPLCTTHAVVVMQSRTEPVMMYPLGNGVHYWVDRVTL